ncbi:hypothetical protein NITMOv2_2789 [Nitrospira moscoviensis]|uniref:Uncharacterized protein n=1 Tax=Nitrospira moscoviensis TaxID=42253 RepID=A0A0K2GE24_NITMO|nr:hypothetical protein NITMOv2_2789 [Nitrospira moscoviensis]
MCLLPASMDFCLHNASTETHALQRLYLYLREISSMFPENGVGHDLSKIPVILLIACTILIFHEFKHTDLMA